MPTSLKYTVLAALFLSACASESLTQETLNEAEPITVLEAPTSDFTPPEGAAEGPGTYGPWNTRLLLATSEDGLNFTQTNVVVTDQGDVPDLAMDENGWIYLYYTGWTIEVEGETINNQTVVAISTDQGETWAYKTLELEGLENMSAPVDPDIQILEDGTFRLFLTADPHDGDGPRSYYSESEDGIHFELGGVAFAQPGFPVLDPNTILIGETWHYFAGGSPNSNWHATSSDGKSFTEAADINDQLTVNGEVYMMSNGLAVNDGYRYFAFSNIDKDIRSFFTTDGVTWEAEDAVLTVDEASGLETEFVKDASVVRLEDGTYLMVYVSLIP